MQKRHWFEGETLRYSSGYAEKPIGETPDGAKTYPASPADQADAIDAVCNPFRVNVQTGRRVGARVYFQTVAGRARLLDVYREQGTMRIIFRDAYYILREVQLRPRDLRALA